VARRKVAGPSSDSATLVLKEDCVMPILLWLLGIPIPIIILLVLLAR
jgi:hypothetical protein